MVTAIISPFLSRRTFPLLHKTKKDSIYTICFFFKLNCQLSALLVQYLHRNDATAVCYDDDFHYITLPNLIKSKGKLHSVTDVVIYT